MGADLMGYMVKGPKKLRFSKAKATKFYKAWSFGGMFLTAPEYDGEAPYEVSLPDFLAAADSFVAEWNMSNYRDLVARVFDDGTKVLFAGDTSWGEEPSGDGYQMMKRVFEFHLDELYGLE